MRLILYSLLLGSAALGLLTAAPGPSGAYPVRRTAAAFHPAARPHYPQAAYHRPNYHHATPAAHSAAQIHHAAHNAAHDSHHHSSHSHWSVHGGYGYYAVHYGAYASYPLSYGGYGYDYQPSYGGYGYGSQTPSADYGVTTTAGTSFPAPPTTGAAGIKNVAVYDDRFVEATITIAPGTTVRWANYGQSAHLIASDSGAWAPRTLNPGDVVNITFSQPGTYTYQCTLHPSTMYGTIYVK